MGLELGAIGGILGGVGGLISGAKGTPTQRQITSRGPASPEERQLQQEAMQQYLAQIGLLGGVEQNVESLDPLRQAALAQQMGVLSGSAFTATPEELQNIENIRQAQIQAGSQDIQDFLNRGQSQVTQSAGLRGLRGQALGQLQGDVLRAGAQQYGNLVNTAGLQAAQSAMQTPYNRVGAQAGAAATGLSYQDQLRQQAIQNRQMASNPALLGYYSNLRDTVSTTPGSGGGFLSGITGAITGGLAGFGQGTGIQGQQALTDYYRNYGSAPMTQTSMGRLPGTLVS